MAELVLLPSVAYRPPSPSAGRTAGRLLNTIMEENEDGSSPRLRKQKQKQPQPQQQWRGAGNGQNDKIEQWLSPLSDHFPTPRGFHFLAAPILPSSPSTVSADDSSCPSPSSNPSNQWTSRERDSIMTDATAFDDLYDVSDDEKMSRKEMLRASGIGRQHSSRRAPSKASSQSSRNGLTPLVIPCGRSGPSLEALSARSDLKKLTTPIPPTPPANVALSPEMVSFMESQHAQEIPTISAPPSLDGSLTSDQMAQISAPPTPVIGGKDEEDTDWSGVQLQPGALATLRALSGTSSESDFEGETEPVIEVPHEEMAETRQQPLRLITNINRLQRSSVVLSPAQHRSLAGLTQLEIPSPGGFFSDLSPRSRRTWHMPGTTPADEAPPPTSTTAEQFYKAPWTTEQSQNIPPPPPRPVHMTHGDFSSSPVEQVIYHPERDEGDPDTAIKVQPTPEPVTARRVPLPSPALPVVPSSPVEEVIPTEIVSDYDPKYARKQQEVALSHLDRTELWLMAQRAYLNVIAGEKDKDKKVGGEVSLSGQREGEHVKTPDPVQQVGESEPQAQGALARKKTVRFSVDVAPATVPRSLPSKLLRQESAYYRAFTDLHVRTSHQDVFVHRLPRFEALQAQRVSLREQHRNQLLGTYQLNVVPMSAKKRMSTNVVRGDDELLDDPEKLRADKEADALRQMAMATWQVAAHKMLNGGRLISAPVAKRLARLSCMAPGPNGLTRDRARILDLGGQGACDWAWYAALQYPNTKIYTVTTKAIRQLSNSNIRGPPNHRQVAVERLSRLPFGDNQFDLISARELHAVLKFVGENGEDEWESCLRECFRVLKPGGYLEFSVLDSDIINAGPLGLAKSVEFGFALKTLGFDPSPSRLFLGRLRRTGFEETRRAWLCLPMGPRPGSQKPPVPPKSMRDSALSGPPVVCQMEAMVTGSTDGIAAVTGLAASWSWERWLLRAEMERAAGELRLADTVTGHGDALREAGESLAGVHAMIEEGRALGSGWRLLKGYARKPQPTCDLTRMGTINLCLDTDSLC